MNNTDPKPHRNIIAKQLISKVIQVAGLMTILLTVFIGYITYTIETREFNREFIEIENSYIDVIRNSLWIDDKETLKMVLIGICQLPGITYADIHSDHTILCSSGNKLPDETWLKFFPISHVYKGKTYQLGDLHVQGDPDYLKNTIIKTVITIALTQALTIFTVCALILWLTHHNVIRRVSTITAYTSSLSPASLATPLSMDDKISRPDDELDELADAINHMRENLLQAFYQKEAIENQLQEHLKNLENTVTMRTAFLRKTNDHLIEEIEERKKVETQKEELISELKTALSDVKTLSGLLPICSHCKKIRDDKGYWNQIETYIRDHSEAEFSHGICQDCLKKHYPDYHHD